jgi:hypothetical protein
VHAHACYVCVRVTMYGAMNTCTCACYIAVAYCTLCACRSSRQTQLHGKETNNAVPTQRQRCVSFEGRTRFLTCAGNTQDTLQALHDGNRTYEAQFGRIFLVCATGKSAQQMLELLQSRMSNNAHTELRVAVNEQAKITRLRLDKLLRSLAEHSRL